MNIEEALAAAIRNPQLLIGIKKRRNELSDFFQKNKSNLSSIEKDKLENEIYAFDQFVWAVETSDDPDLVHKLKQMFVEAKKMADSEKYSNDEIAEFCITRSQAEIMPLFILEFPNLYPNAEYDKMVYHMQLLLDKAYADLDYKNLTAQEMVEAVLQAIQ